MKEIFRGLKYIKENKFIKYTVVGISNTGISIMFNYVFLFCGIFPGFSYALSYIIGGVNGFIWNKKWVFENKNNKVWWKYILVNTVLLVLGSLLTTVISNIIGKYITPIIVAGVLLFVGFILNKNIVFKKTKNINM